MGLSLSRPSGAGAAALRNQSPFPSSALVKSIVASDDDAAILRVRVAEERREKYYLLQRKKSSITAASESNLFSPCRFLFFLRFLF